MLANPDIKAWFDRLQGQKPGASGSAPIVNRNAVAEALQGIVTPQEAPAFQAPQIRPGAEPVAPQPYAQGRGIVAGLSPTQVGQGGGGRGDLGGSAIAAGLGKLGQGLEQGLAAFKARRDLALQNQARFSNPRLTGGSTGGGTGAGGAVPGAGLSNPPISPISPTAGGPPMFTRPGGGTSATNGISPIGAPGGVPTFVQSGASGIAAPGDIKRAVDDAFTKVGENSNVNRADLHDYLATGGHDLDPKTQAYCAAFVGAALQHAGIQGASSNLASDYINWGKPVSGDVQRGDVLVVNRPGVVPGQQGDHVGFATGKTDANGRIEMVSGNTQGGQVATTYIDPNAVVARRYDPNSGSTGIYPAVTSVAMGGGAPQMGATEAYIRDAAAKRGIDPDVAVKVAKSEGLGANGEPNATPGDKNSSFGPFQLHYGGVAEGGNAVPGLGDEFTRVTGLDARDPSTLNKQIDFSLDHAAKNGWGEWHGAKNTGIGSYDGIGQPPQSAQAAPAPPVSPPQTAGQNDVPLPPIRPQQIGQNDAPPTQQGMLASALANPQSPDQQAAIPSFLAALLGDPNAMPDFGNSFMGGLSGLFG